MVMKRVILKRVTTPTDLHLTSSTQNIPPPSPIHPHLPIKDVDSTPPTQNILAPASTRPHSHIKMSTFLN